MWDLTLGLIFKSQVKQGLPETWRPKIDIPSKMLALQENLAGFCNSKARAAKKSMNNWY